MEGIFEKALARRQQRDADWTENDRQQYSKLTAEYQTLIQSNRHWNLILSNRLRTMRYKIGQRLPKILEWYRKIRGWLHYTRGMPGAKR